MDAAYGVPAWLLGLSLLVGAGGLTGFISMLLMARTNKRKAQADTDVQYANAAKLLVEQGLSLIEPMERRLKDMAAEQDRLLVQQAKMATENTRLRSDLVDARNEVSKLTAEVISLKDRIRQLGGII